MQHMLGLSFLKEASIFLRKSKKCLCQAQSSRDASPSFLRIKIVINTFYQGSDCRSVVGKALLVCRTESGTAGRFSRQGVAAEAPYRCGERSLVGSRKPHPRVVDCKWHPEDSRPEEKRCLKIRFSHLDLYSFIKKQRLTLINN